MGVRTPLTITTSLSVLVMAVHSFV
jgi:hypothetical protein